MVSEQNGEDNEDREGRPASIGKVRRTQGCRREAQRRRNQRQALLPRPRRRYRQVSYFHGIMHGWGAG